MTELADSVSRLEREALSQLEGVLAGAAMCRVDGERARPAKRWEGRSAALAQVSRALRRQDAGVEADLVAGIRSSWEGRLVTQHGEAWDVYNRAGLEALAELQA